MNGYNNKSADVYEFSDLAEGPMRTRGSFGPVVVGLNRRVISFSASALRTLSNPKRIIPYYSPANRTLVFRPTNTVSEGFALNNGAMYASRFYQKFHLTQVRANAMEMRARFKGTIAEVNTLGKCLVVPLPPELYTL